MLGETLQLCEGHAGKYMEYLQDPVPGEQVVLLPKVSMGRIKEYFKERQYFTMRLFTKPVRRVQEGIKNKLWPFCSIVPDVRHSRPKLKISDSQVLGGKRRCPYAQCREHLCTQMHHFKLIHLLL